LLAPNTSESFEALVPHVVAAAAALFPGREASITQAARDRRDRLALDVRVI
jgi:hypothetical protein